MKKTTNSFFEFIKKVGLLLKTFFIMLKNILNKTIKSTINFIKKAYIFMFEFIKKHVILKKTLGFILLFFIILILYEIFYDLGRGPNDDLQTIRTLMVIVPFISLGIGAYLKGKGKLNIKTLCFLLMITGFAMRIGYAFYSGVNTRQHDVEMGSFDNLNLNGQGHFSYIYILYSTGKLPEEIRWQFYHPPLWHALIASFMHVLHFFHSSYGVSELFEESIVVASFVSCITLYGIKELLFTMLNKDNDYNLNKKNNIIIAIALGLISLHSQFFIMAAWMNNEGLAFMFTVFALLYAFKFHNDKKYIDVILCAIMIGLGVSSKVSAALICLPIGIIFLIDLITQTKEKKYNIYLKGLVFILICFPLASWFPIRNIIKFGAESISVPVVNPNGPLGVIQYSFIDRFGFANPFKEFNESIFCQLQKQDTTQDYNVWIYTLKCSIFGEYSYWHGDFFANCLYLFNIFIAPFSFISMFIVTIKDLVKKDKEIFVDLIMCVVFIMCIASYIFFQIQHPVTCTQDFRYMTLILIPGTYFIAKCYVNISNNKFKKVFKPLILFLVIGFMASSFLYFISCR